MKTLTPRAPAAPASRTTGRRTSHRAAAISLLPLIMLGGCAAFPAMQVGPSMPGEQRRLDQEEFHIPSSTDDSISRSPRRSMTSETIPGAPPPAAERPAATAEQIAALVSDELVDANLAPQSIPQFVASIFGGVLNVPFTMGPDVAGRSELVAGGSGGSISKRALFAVAQQALQQYGIDVYIDGNAVTVGASRQGGPAPEIARGRNPSSATGRVVHFYAVQTIEVNALQSLLQDLYPNLRGTRLTPDPKNNALIISGSGREVSQVVRALRDIDQPRFAGAEVFRIEPAFWGTEALAAALEQVLMAEGYLISRQAIVGRSLVMLSFPTANQILVFGRDPVLMDRVRHWANTLDQPASLGDKASTFVYQVRNTDAQSVGQLAMGQGGGTGSSQRPSPTGVPGTPPASQSDGDSLSARGNGSNIQGGQFMGGRVLVDTVGNRIIFTGTAADFAHLRSLLTTLDTPAPQVVIEVMIAEVTLNDNTSLGVQLFGSEERGDGLLSGSTEAIELPGGGLLATFTGADFRARLTAAAGNSRVNILQRPQLVARSGGTARFQVGTDVPIITSQRATNTQTGSDGTDILQSVQYRQTGVILDLQPVVYGDRVDITISQEISEVGKSTNPAIASPPILNRSLTTQIALTDGWTGVLGGLISNNYSKSNSGVPFLKDIPVVGSAFQNNTVSGARTELLILITPHVVRGDEDMAELADRYTGDMNAAFRTGRGWSYTLTPFNVGFGVRGIGLDLPRPGRPSDARAQRDARQNAVPAPITEPEDPTAAFETD
ncbi:secretin N-terminal domain-containing protein [Brevundimonas vesicularis]|uniref:secretin N-terminal domain-containing protein n=1 Tax=Brevundimonas vesicularis TaxID=41276 RepID=UPI0038D4461E